MTTSTMTPIARGGSKLLLRLPPTLHERVRNLAAQESVSVNTLIATLLSGAIGFNLVPDPDEPQPTGVDVQALAQEDDEEPVSTVGDAIESTRVDSIDGIEDEP